MEWFKFYHNKWLTDIAVGRLLPEDRLCFITLLCLASQSDGDRNGVRNGVVTGVTERDIIALSRLPENIHDTSESPFHHAQGCFKRMQEVGLIDMLDDEVVVVKNFEKRQNQALTSAERQRYWRERQKQNSDENDTVTKSNGACNNRNARVDKIREDKSNTNTKAVAKATRTFSQLGVEVVKAFESVNPTAKSWYGNTTQRGACDRLIEQHGLDTVLKVISILPKTNKMQYVPTVTTPLQLETKWVALESALAKYKSDKTVLTV